MAAIRAVGSAGRGLDPAAGRFGSFARETPAHSTSGRPSLGRCLSSPRSAAGFDLDGAVHALRCIVGIALASPIEIKGLISQIAGVGLGMAQTEQRQELGPVGGGGQDAGAGSGEFEW